MSGIAGIVHFDERPVASGLIEAMTASMAYRGPDGIDHWVQGNVALGHCILRTTPEQIEETQPLANEDASLVLVMDGRVDNWQELRADLLAKGAHLRTRSDAELVLRAYETWRNGALDRIDGDFAFAIWDAHARRLFCARDRMGNKLFNYYFDGKTLVFASEVQAVVHAVPAGLSFNEGLAAEFLSGSWRSLSDTFWTGIQRLPAAHRLDASGKGAKAERYWAPDLSKRIHCSSDGEYIEMYRELLTDNVRRLSRTAGPLACEVSGGLDSSAIFAIAEHLRRRGELLAPGVDGYTLKFDDDSEANELAYCRAVADFLASPVAEIEPTYKSIQWCEQEARRGLDFPYYPNGIMSLGIRDAARQAGSRVLLSGLGGDQLLFASSNYYAESVQSGDWSGFLQHCRDDRMHYGTPRTIWRAFRHGGYPLLPEPLRIAIRTALHGGRIAGLDPQSWLTPRLARLLASRTQAMQVQQPDRLWIGQREKLMSLYSALVAHSCEVEERLAAGAGIEMRRPFWSARLAEFTLSTPNRMRQRGPVDKYCHREAMAGLLPPLVLNRRDKADFTTTYLNYSKSLSDFFRSERTPTIAEWVKEDDVASLLEKLGDAQFGAWPEKATWLLFGCLALQEAGKLLHSKSPYV